MGFENSRLFIIGDEVETIGGKRGKVEQVYQVTVGVRWYNNTWGIVSQDNVRLTNPPVKTVSKRQPTPRAIFIKSITHEGLAGYAWDAMQLASSHDPEHEADLIRLFRAIENLQRRVDALENNLARHLIMNPPQRNEN